MFRFLFASNKPSWGLCLSFTNTEKYYANKLTPRGLLRDWVNRWIVCSSSDSVLFSFHVTFLINIQLGVTKARPWLWTLSARWEPNVSNVTREKPRSGAVWVSDCEGNCLFQYSSLFGLLSGYNCRLRASIRRNFVKLNWATCIAAKHWVYEPRCWTLRRSEQYYSLNSNPSQTVLCEQCYALNTKLLWLWVDGFSSLRI